MPQATDEDRQKYTERFGDIDCGHAIEVLKLRGYKLTRDWNWVAPHEPTDEELFWLGFLVDEWDFGWIVETKGKLPPAPLPPGNTE